MEKLLSIGLLLCLLWGMALPGAAEEAVCEAGCILAQAHEGDCVTIPAVEAEDTEALDRLQNDPAALIDSFRSKYPRFTYTDGDLTIQLSAGSYGNLACKHGLDGGTLTLQGVPGTTVMSLTVSAPDIHVDGIAFTAVPAVTTDTPCAVTNCEFRAPGNGFLLRKGEGGGLPGLQLSGNTYYNSGKTFSMKVGYGTGEWNVTVPAEVSTVDGALFEVSCEEVGEKARKYSFQVGTLPQQGWGFSYTADCGYDNCYVVNDGMVTATGKTFAVENAGDYFVVSGTVPAVTQVNTSTIKVEVDELQSRYLRKFSFKCSFKAVKVTDSKGKEVYSSRDSNGWVTFSLKSETKDTYTVTEVKTTTTVTKTTTTSRKYTYKYQDYFLVTPQGFSDAMRRAVDGLVTLNCLDAARKPVSLPAASLAEAAEKGCQVLVKTKNAELTLDAAALKSLAQQAKGTTVLLQYSSLNHKTLTTVGQASLKSHLAQHPNHSADLAFLVSASSDSEDIEDLQQGTVTLKIPFIVLPGTEEQENQVYALQGERTTDARETAVAEGYLTTKLLDLTEHMVFQVGEPVETTAETVEATEETLVETTAETTQPETEPETEPPQPPEPEESKAGGLQRVLIIVMAVMAAAVCGVLGIVLLSRRKS